jgi:hypothetical protein
VPQFDTFFLFLIKRFTMSSINTHVIAKVFEYEWFRLLNDGVNGFDSIRFERYVNLPPRNNVTSKSVRLEGGHFLFETVAVLNEQLGA